MTRNQKIALGAGGVIILAIIGYLVYRRRWQTFNNIGNSQWLPTEHSGRLALRMDTDRHGIKQGDKIEIEHANSRTPKGSATVLDVVQKQEGSGLSTYVVTDKFSPVPTDDVSGKVRIVG